MGIHSNLSSRYNIDSILTYSVAFRCLFVESNLLLQISHPPPPKKKKKQEKTQVFDGFWPVGLLVFHSVPSGMPEKRPISKHGATETDHGDVADTGCIHCVSLSTSVKLSTSPSRGKEEIRKGVDLKRLRSRYPRKKNKKNSNKKPEKNWDKY